MKDKWLLQAVVLGLAFFLAILAWKPIGVSTQFSVISGKAHRLIHDVVKPEPLIVSDGEAKHGYRSTNAYYDRSGGKLAGAIVGFEKDLAFFLSIFIGSSLGALLMSGKSRASLSDLKRKMSMAEISRSFIAGFLLLFGARLAGGCTSGHMMSGMMQSSISGFVFAALVFAVAIPVAIGGEKKWS
ncbi:MAG: YeeE/YedE thiosulfate transporter family protein [Eubacteriales bacterium]|nr:YeeE/YedE thiosulfate transporter family protein [Eubacteriales bacterium]